MSAPVFRDATPDDVPAIVALVESAYRGESSRAGWTTEADLLDGQRTDAGSVRELVAAPDSMVLLAQQPGADALLACCHLAHPAVGIPARTHRRRSFSNSSKRRSARLGSPKRASPYGKGLCSPVRM